MEQHQGFSSFRNHCFLAGLYSMIVVCEIAPRRGQVNNCNYKQYALSPQSAVLEVGGVQQLRKKTLWCSKESMCGANLSLMIYVRFNIGPVLVLQLQCCCQLPNL